MQRSVILILSILSFALIGSAWAQNKHHNPKPGPLATGIDHRIMMQLKLMRKGYDSRTLSPQQQGDSKVALGNVRKKEMEDLTENGTGDLTANQTVELDQLLDANLVKLGTAPGADQSLPSPTPSK